MQHIFKIKLGDKTITARAFTYEEFQKLVEYKSTGRLKEAVLDIINECIGINALELEKCEAEYLFLMLWCHSLAKENFKSTWVCGVCNKEKEYNLNVERTQIPDTEPYLLDLGGVKIKFRPPRFTEDDDIMQMVIACIDYIVIDNQEFDINDLNEQDFDTILSMLTTEHVETIIDELTGPQITLAVPIKCDCGESGIHLIRGLNEFLTIL